MPKRLSEAGIKRLAPKARRYTIWDSLTPTLGIKIMPSGSRVWIVQLKRPGRTSRSKLTLGQFPGLGVAEARARASAWRQLVADGTDPRQHELDQRRQTQVTFGAFVEKRFLPSRTNRRRVQDASEIKRALLPHWGNRPIDSIKPRDVKALFRELVATTPYFASNVWGHAVAILKLATFDEVIETSPMASVDKRMIFPRGSLPPRDRVLTDDEIAALWRNVRRMGFPVSQFYRLLLLLGVRLNELRQARWQEFPSELLKLLRSEDSVDWAAVSSEAKQWSLPRDRTKNDTARIVPLPDAACAVLAEIPLFAGSDFVFTNGSGHLWIGHKFKKAIDARMLRSLKAAARLRGDDPSEVALAGWVNHDLRRVLRTGLAALGIDDVTAEMALGHTQSGLRKTYNRHRYQDEIRTALNAWANRVAEIVGEAAPTTNVVELKRASR